MPVLAEEANPARIEVKVKNAYLAILLLLGLAGSCAPPAIGDPCEDSIDCDIQGKRYCDLTQPKGYCTLEGCEKSTCPEDSVCVMFRPKPDRLASTWCMATCDSKSDCRDGYSCKQADQLGEAQSTAGADAGGSDAEPLAKSLDKASTKFCTVPLQE